MNSLREKFYVERWKDQPRILGRARTGRISGRVDQVALAVRPEETPESNREAKGGTHRGDGVDVEVRTSIRGVMNQSDRNTQVLSSKTAKSATDFKKNPLQITSLTVLYYIDAKQPHIAF